MEAKGTEMTGKLRRHGESNKSMEWPGKDTKLIEQQADQRAACVSGRPWKHRDYITREKSITESERVRLRFCEHSFTKF